MIETERMRIDKWLWVARFFKTRSLAATALASNKIKCNGEHVKPARELKIGDRLDITVCPGVLASVKGEQAAKSASLGAVLAWRTEAEQKRIRHGAAAALLVVQRAGHGRDRAAAWRCWVLGLGRDAWETTLAEAATYLRAAGYGDPITTATEGTT